MARIVQMLILLCISSALSASAFYIDPDYGSDDNPGTSKMKAWQTLAKVNSYLFNPGDTILLKSGSAFTGILHLKRQGSPGKPIVVDKYGVDKLPLIRGDGKEHPYVVFLDNVQYCDSAIAAYNYVERPSLGGDGGIGIWTWSSDNCIVQFNEVTGTYGTHDAQAFDSDWNCRNNIYQYNYSHDNAGGFMLVCTPVLSPSNLGCLGTIVRYNLSVNDGAITNTFAIWGPCENTRIYNNTFFADTSFHIPLVEHGDWNGLASGTYFYNNLVYTRGSYHFNFRSSKENVFGHNLWFGKYKDGPADSFGVFQDPLFRGPGFTKPDDFILRKESPAAGRGMHIPDNGGRDYRGCRIPAENTPTIGAFESCPCVMNVLSKYLSN